MGRKLEYFLATGNLVSESGLDLQQTAGFTIVAERLNFWRFVSRLRPAYVATCLIRAIRPPC